MKIKFAIRFVVMSRHFFDAVNLEIKWPRALHDSVVFEARRGHRDSIRSPSEQIDNRRAVKRKIGCINKRLQRGIGLLEKQHNFKSISANLSKRALHIVDRKKSIALRKRKIFM